MVEFGARQRQCIAFEPRQLGIVYGLSNTILRAGGLCENLRTEDKRAAEESRPRRFEQSFRSGATKTRTKARRPGFSHVNLTQFSGTPAYTI